MFAFGHRVRNRKFAQKLIVLFSRPVGLDMAPGQPQNIVCVDEYGEQYVLRGENLIDGWGEAYDLYKNLTSVQERCTELLVENRALKKQLQESQVETMQKALSAYASHKEPNAVDA